MIPEKVEIAVTEYIIRTLETEGISSEQVAVCAKLIEAVWGN